MLFNTIECKQLALLLLLLTFFNTTHATSKNIAVGSAHSCALTSSQQIECWGADFAGQSTPPEGQFLQLSAGMHTGCAIRNDNALICWGGYYDPTAVPQGTFIHVSAYKERYCAVRTDNTLVCWGEISEEEIAEMPQTAEFIEVYVGNYKHSCAIKTDRSVACWGYDKNPFDAPSPSMQGSVPAEIQGRAFSAFAVGNLHNCGILADTQTLYCWGANSHSEINAPQDVTFTDIAAGGYTTCGLMSNGLMRCWGNFDEEQTLAPPNSDCQCGLNEDPLQCMCIQQVGTPLREISSIGYHICGISADGRQRICWGKNNRGQADTTFAPQFCQAVGVNRDTSEMFFINPADFSITTKPLLGLPALPLSVDTYINGLYFFATQNGVYVTSEPSDANSYTTLQHPSLIDIQDISVSPDGDIWGWDSQTGLWSITANPANGIPDINTFNINVAPPLGINITHLSWEYVGDVVYGVQQNSGENAALWSYQPSTGAVKTICASAMSSLGQVTAFDAMNESWLLFSTNQQTHIRLLNLDGCQWIFDGEVAPQLPNIVGLGWQCL